MASASQSYRIWHPTVGVLAPHKEPIPFSWKESKFICVFPFIYRFQIKIKQTLINFKTADSTKFSSKYKRKNVIIVYGSDFTSLAVWMGNPTEPKSHQRHRTPGGASRETLRRSSQGFGQGAPEQPRRRRCPWTTPAWWRRWSRRPGGGRRRWSSSSGCRSHGPSAGRRAARRSRWCCKAWWFCHQNTWPTGCWRRRTSWRHPSGPSKCKSVMSSGQGLLWNQQKIDVTMVTQK